MRIWMSIHDVPDEADVFVDDISQPLIIHFRSGYTLAGAYYSYTVDRFMWMGHELKEEDIDYWSYDYSNLVGYVEVVPERS